MDNIDRALLVVMALCACVLVGVLGFCLAVILR